MLPGVGQVCAGQHRGAAYMTTISAETILCSHNMVSGDILTTLLLRYPRFIHAELMTHRVFSRNAASSRAIPVGKLIADVEQNPARPLWWGANRPGMQAPSELPQPEKDRAQDIWEASRLSAIAHAKVLADTGAHKQIVNRLLEPYAHITVLVSSTEWANFLHLRDHPDAEPHMQMLAREIAQCVESEDFVALEPGEWHLPFVGIDERGDHSLEALQALSVARCASTSYKTVDGFDMTIDRAQAVYARLISSDPMHASPAEHVACVDDGLYNPLQDRTVFSHPEQHGNFTGFRQLRHML